jgi:predicted GNAT superfamily acetyltransferase
MTLKKIPPITIREITDNQGFRECLKLQQETWGRGFIDLVPGSMLMIAQKTGGLVLGAFAGDRLVGFVFSFAGWKGDLKIQWSDMLAVKKPYRNLRIGLRLKLRQRQILRKRGVQEIYWTFDPLESKNAYFNFQKLGIVVEEYLPNLYGVTHSPLHRGLETDRFLATWRIQNPQSNPVADGKIAVSLGRSNLINECALSRENHLIPGQPNLRLLGKKVSRLERLYLEIPENISAISRKNLALARQWQLCTRLACRHYLRKGYMIRRFISALVGGRRRTFYELCRK